LLTVILGSDLTLLQGSPRCVVVHGQLRI
jgi:hypothetical protein